MRSIVLIDFELAGPNYRGFDIFKLYRRGQLPVEGEVDGEACQDSTGDDRPLRRFAAAYLHALPSSQGSESKELSHLMSEVLLFEPLTWLEASIFFLFALTEDEAHSDKWTALACHRWRNYEKSKHRIDKYAHELQRI